MPELKKMEEGKRYIMFINDINNRVHNHPNHISLYDNTSMSIYNNLVRNDFIQTFPVDNFYSQLTKVCFDTCYHKEELMKKLNTRRQLMKEYVFFLNNGFEFVFANILKDSFKQIRALEITNRNENTDVVIVNIGNGKEYDSQIINYTDRVLVDYTEVCIDLDLDLFCQKYIENYGLDIRTEKLYN